MSEPHHEIWVKVNALADEGIAPLVELLSRIPELETLASCQGYSSGVHGYVIFKMRGWREIGTLLFDRILPLLPEDLRPDVSLEIICFDTDCVHGRLSVCPGSINAVVRCLTPLGSYFP